jgi:Mg2+/Co2+ transporter CorC
MSEAVRTHAAVVREYAGVAPQVATLELLKSIEQQYVNEFADAKPDDFVPLQQRLKQVRAIAAVLRGDAHATGLL